MKADAPPLLEAGIHHVTSYRLKEIAVDAFPSDMRRAELFGKFLTWREGLRSAGISGVVWLDGSFLTSKHGPSDIDLVLFAATSPKVWPQDQQLQAAKLLDQATCKAVFEIDLYPVDRLDPQFDVIESYWRGWFGFCRDRKTAKGIAEVVI